MNKTSSPKPLTSTYRSMPMRKCQIHGCKNKAGYYGLCRLHYRRAWRVMRVNPNLRKLPYLDTKIMKTISQPKTGGMAMMIEKEKAQCTVKIDDTKVNKIVDACRELRKMSGYPYTDDKDLPFVRDLLDEFPNMDLVAEIKQWQIWLLDNQEKVNKKKVNHRSRLRRWCLNSASWKANKGSSQKQRHPGKSGSPGNKNPQYEFEKDRPDKDQTKFEEVW